MINRFIPELLIPVGGMEQLYAAVASGADAVYMGGENFNARMNAENFGKNHIREAIRTAHENGVKVHITQNTLLRDDEMDVAVRQAYELYETGIDALIVQDRGFAYIMKSLIPELPLHLSTQGSVSDINGVLEAEKSGFSRVILARELSLEEIRKIKQSCSVEIEVFVHGAICICYSGQCHMSSFIGGRSGNRGQCAQPCRLPYLLYADGMREKSDKSAGSYLLSPSDMYLLEHLEDLADVGVDSIKIEGRMRSPEYVASVTSAYRKALDDINSGVVRSLKDAERDRQVLASIYNRGDFTDAYLRGDSGMSLMSTEIPKHKGIEIGKVLSVDVKRGHAEVVLTDDLNIGDGVELRSDSDSRGNIITYIKSASKNKNKEYDKESKLIKEARSGQRVIIGDLDLKSAKLGAGSKLYRTRDSRLMKEIKAAYSKPIQRIAVDMKFEAAVGNYASLTVTAKGKDSDISLTVKSEQLMELAVKKASEEEDIRKQLAKTGGTAYRMSDCSVNLYGNVIVPAAVINGMRRAALEQLTALRLDSWKNVLASVSMEEGIADAACDAAEVQEAASKERASAELCRAASDGKAVVNLVFNRTGRETETAEALLQRLLAQPQQDRDSKKAFYRLEELIIEFSFPYEKAFEICKLIEQFSEYERTSGVPELRAVAYLPAVIRQGVPENTIEELISLCRNGSLSAISLGHPSQMELFTDIEGISLRLDESANLYNSYSFRYWRKRGIERATLSYELNVSEIANMKRDLGTCHVCDMREVAVYGRIPLMITAHCPVACGKKGRCMNESFELEDRKGVRYPLIPDMSDCSCAILSYKPLDIIKEIPELSVSGVRAFRVNVSDESTENIYNKIKSVIEKIK